jgi:zinc transport system ATP-binding protein
MNHAGVREPVVDVRDGCVALGGRPVLRGIDLTVSAGETVAVLGANGSGKSTLVRSVLGLTPLRSGSVELFGTPLPRFRGWRRIGYVPQRVTATAGVPASVWEVVSAGRLARRRALQPMRRADKEAVRRALAAVELDDRARERVATLSGGQHQRVLIARALAGEPELLVLDEPTAGVDVASQETFAAILGRLTARGTTVVLVAHEMGPLAPLIQRAVVMRDGRVAYDGAPLESFRDVGHPHLHDPAPAGAHFDYYPDVATTIDRATRVERPAP